MGVLLYSLSECTEEKILALSEHRSVLFVSHFKAQDLPKNIEWIDGNTFNIKAWRGLINSKNYDTLIMKMNSVSNDTQFAFHLLEFKNVYLFTNVADSAMKLSLDVPSTLLLFYGQEPVPLDELNTPGTEGFFPDISDAWSSPLKDPGSHLFVANTVQSRAAAIDYAANHIAMNKAFSEFHSTEAMRVGLAVFPQSHANQVLLAILLEIKYSLDAIHLYTKQFKYLLEEGESETALRLPLVNKQFLSDTFIKKKDRLNDCCCKAMKYLYDEGFLDGNLRVIEEKLFGMSAVSSLLLRVYGTTDQKLIMEMKEASSNQKSRRFYGEIYLKDGIPIFSTHESSASSFSNFKQTHIIDIWELSENFGTLPGLATSEDELEMVHRKIPEAMRHKTETMWLYSFNGGRSGILCGEAFSEFKAINRHGEPVLIKRESSLTPTADQLFHLNFYQLLFFKFQGCVYPSAAQRYSYHYYAVPLCSDLTIDWDYLHRLYSDFLLERALDSHSLDGQLLWNPFSQLFYISAGVFDMNIDDLAGDITFLEYYESKYRIRLIERTGKKLIKGYALDQVMAYYKKQMYSGLYKHSHIFDQISVLFNYGNRKEINNGEADRIDVDINTYSANSLSNILIDSGGISNTADNLFDTLILSGETCFLTSVRTTIVTDSLSFYANFWLFENACIAHELSQALRLDAPLELVAQALVHSKDNSLLNYERLEFLGDCALKFCVVGYICGEDLSVGKMVKLKDLIISNESLYDCCFRTKIHRFISMVSSHPKMFQAPVVVGLTQFKEYFQVEGIFKSDNLNSYLHTLSTSNGQRDKKVYADVVEAIIGTVLLKGGVNAVFSFITQLGIITPKVPGISTLQEYCKVCHAGVSASPLMDVSYNGVMATEAVQATQELLGYTFKNPGLLERAMVHPSFSNNIFGSHHFQLLELIGDCTLDLFVVKKLYDQEELSNPLLLHTAKIDLVNNQLLGILLVCTGLASLAKIGPGLSPPKINSGSIPKTPLQKGLGDIFEAIVGAILVDIGWDFDEFTKIAENRIWPYLLAFQAVK